jgi:serine/threonine protein kinase
VIQEGMVLPVGAIVQDARGAHYAIEGVLGKGGFSAVYKVRDRHTRQQYALKEIIDPDAEDRRILTTEAELLMRLNHPSLPHVYQVFENAKLKRIYLLMDYIEGKTLQQLLREHPERRLPLPVILVLLNPVVDALDYLRSQHPPVVHRDIKPANIIVPKGAFRAMLVDFGLAKEYIEGGTTAAFRYGTPGFAAPEQYRQGTNLRTDVYGLAATVYALLTGTVPVDSISRVVEPLENDPLLRADQIHPAVPVSVGKVIHHAMNLSASQRFASVHEFWQALRLAAEHPDIEPDFTSPGTQVVRLTDMTASSSVLEVRKRSIRIILLLLIILVVLGAVIDSVLWTVYQLHH